MHKLTYYQLKFSKLPKQGSDDWLNGRTLSFGGSEINTVLGKNKYETWESLKYKKSHKIYDRLDTTEWGHLFEPISKIYIEKDFGKIYEFGSIPHSYYPVCYSPDGIIVENNDLTLLEIKNPIMRGVKSIPDQYLDQVQTGLNVINCKYCLFAQFRFRRCKMNTVPWSVTYDRFYHKEFRKRCKDSYPISYGYIYWDVPGDLCDLGTKAEMLPYFINIRRKPEIIIAKEFRPTHGVVMMWKLFEFVYTGIIANHDFLKSKETLLWQKYAELFCSTAKTINIKEIIQDEDEELKKANEKLKISIGKLEIFKLEEK